MNHYRLLTIITLFLLVSSAPAQDTSKFRLLHFTSSHTLFPDTHRARGYVYDSVLYTFSGHYNDSSVLLVIPKHFESAQNVDLVFWFHGWNNSIDTAVGFYRLTEQFINSKRNAVLVLPETARNAPDSYGGKLEQPGMFKSLVNDVLDELKSRNLVPSKAVPGNILLCGHSGAFLVIADILQNGHMPVSEVFLFDALYSQVDKFLAWIIRDQSHHFIHWYTNKGGGTDIMSDTMMLQLKSLHRDFAHTEENMTNANTIKNNRILFVHSLREHNVIINNPDNFQLLLENSYFLRPYPTVVNGYPKN